MDQLNMFQRRLLLFEDSYDLIFKGEDLKDEHTLDKYNIKNGDTITHMDRNPHMEN